MAQLCRQGRFFVQIETAKNAGLGRSEEHTSELQSPCNLECRLLLEKINSGGHRGRVGADVSPRVRPDQLPRAVTGASTCALAWPPSHVARSRCALGWWCTPRQPDER